MLTGQVLLYRMVAEMCLVCRIHAAVIFTEQQLLRQNLPLPERWRAE
jgi:hypothetical protein